MPGGDRPDRSLDFGRGKGAQHRRLHAAIVGPILHAKDEVRAACHFGHLGPIGRLELVAPFENVADILVARDQQEASNAEIRPETTQQGQQPARIVQEIAGNARPHAIVRAEPGEVEFRQFRQRTLRRLGLVDSLEILGLDHANAGPQLCAHRSSETACFRAQ